VELARKEAPVTTITASEALPGDVVLDSGGTEWKRGDSPSSWSTFSGPVLVFGPWEDRYGPQGELTLLVRDGEPAGDEARGFGIWDEIAAHIDALRRAGERLFGPDAKRGCTGN
jgi:hypothetical protein